MNTAAIFPAPFYFVQTNASSTRTRGIRNTLTLTQICVPYITYITVAAHPTTGISPPLPLHVAQLALQLQSRPLVPNWEIELLVSGLALKTRLLVRSRSTIWSPEKRRGASCNLQQQRPSRHRPLAARWPQHTDSTAPCTFNKTLCPSFPPGSSHAIIPPEPSSRQHLASPTLFFVFLSKQHNLLFHPRALSKFIRPNLEISIQQAAQPRLVYPRLSYPN